ENELVPVPAALAPEDVAMVILNYVTAYQMLQRVAHAKEGEKALLLGASGGVGTALIQLGSLAGLQLFGTASPDKHALLESYGVKPVNYHAPDLSAQLRRMVPGGFDLVFDGLGGNYNALGWSLLGRGGRLVSYAPPDSLNGLLSGVLKIIGANLLPNGKSSAFYGISALYRRDKRPFMQDLPLLLNLLESGKIKPIITARFAILEAARANELLESGRVMGNVALLAPELL
ncbi:MAG: zinc-binding dehydrogenase, partial [Anaerolineae bacterium]|nr:zinc-binding dehydrogenase [Anaerolineae bacterium]